MDKKTTALRVDPANLSNQITSSQLHSYQYDAPEKTLYIKFNSSHKTTTYAYAGVSSEKAAEMDEVESKGSFFYREIKNKYDFDKIVHEDQSAEGSGTGT